MRATTHTEVYRRFEGQLRRRPLRFLTLAWSGIRMGFKRKLPALLLFTPPAITCIVFAFRVHFSFALQSGEMGVAGPGGQIASGQITAMLGDVVTNILMFVQTVKVFALIAIAWYGAGLIAEDRRMGAHLLYFSRPITRLEYIAGKFLAAATFGAISLLTPCLVICGVAAFSSPDWSFLTQEWGSILRSIGFCLLWIGTATALVLAISSLMNRKTIALVGIIGLVFVSQAFSNVLAEISGDDRFRLFNLFDNFSRIGDWLFDKHLGGLTWGVEASFWSLAALWLACFFVLASRVRKMEVVA